MRKNSSNDEKCTESGASAAGRTARAIAGLSEANTVKSKMVPLR